MTEDVLQRLAALISARRAESASKSYTRCLLYTSDAADE